MATTLPTTAEMLSVTQRALRTKLDPGGTGAINLRPGSKLDLFQSAALALGARNTAHIADRAAARSVQTAVGEDLDIIAADIYNTKRKPANASTGTVYLQRPSGGTTVIPAGTRFSVPAIGSQPSVTVAADNDIPADNGVLTVAVPCTCTQTGIVGNVLLASITSIVDPLPDTGWELFVPGSPDTVQFAGGDNGEVGNDDAFRARIIKSSFTAATNPGTSNGISAYLLALPGVFDVTLIAPGDGSIRVFAGDVNFQLSDALRAQIVLALQKVRALGNPGIVLHYTVVPVTINGTIYMNNPAREFDTTAIGNQAVANVIKYFLSGRESPDSYFLSAISAAYETANPEVQSVVLAAPLADIKPLQPSGYASATTINRYVTSAAYISVAVTDPQTQ